MKSPVFGCGRNWKHKKSWNGAGEAGSVKMKGKKVKRMSCGCCTCIDKRDQIKNKISKDEMNAI